MSTIDLIFSSNLKIAAAVHELNGLYFRFNHLLFSGDDDKVVDPALDWNTFQFCCSKAVNQAIAEEAETFAEVNVKLRFEKREPDFS